MFYIFSVFPLGYFLRLGKTKVSSFLFLTGSTWWQNRYCYKVSRLYSIDWVVFLELRSLSRVGYFYVKHDGQIVRQRMYHLSRWFHRSKPQERTKSRVWSFTWLGHVQTAAREMTELCIETALWGATNVDTEVAKKSEVNLLSGLKGAVN